MTSSSTHASSSTNTGMSDAAHAAQAAHTSLYRKYRPEHWDEVIGQSQVVDVLKHEVEKPQPNHAFLFAGSRGTGKTTVARIFARNIGTSPEDIYEIDAASNTSVEDIRTLNEGVHTLPLKSKFKVYILDEVHMLSKSAFNAFLKTLEEPPRHVIFILATTELHKIPETIISRCQVFHFKKPTPETLKMRIKQVALAEGNIFEDEALSLEIIASSGRGSFRDTLTNLQKILTVVGGDGQSASGQRTIPHALVVEVIGVASIELTKQFAELFALAGKQPAADSIKKGLEILSAINASEMDIELFIDSVIMHVRRQLLAGALEGVVGVRALTVLLESKDIISKTAIATLPLELALYKYFG